MFKKLFGRKKKSSPVESVSGGIKHACTKDKDGACPNCGGTLTQRSCWLFLASMADCGTVETDSVRFCESCPTAVFDPKAVRDLAKRSKLKNALPVGISASEGEDPVEFETLDGSSLTEESAKDPDLMQAVAQMTGIDYGAMSQMGGADGSQMPAQAPRRPVSSTEKKRKKNKRKQAAKARKRNRRK